MAIRKITEQFQQDDTIINTSLGPFESVFKQNLVYSQYNWNISIGAGYRIAIEKFTPYFGTEAIFCHYGKGVQKGDYYSYVKDPNNPPPGSLDENTYTMNIPSGFGSGLGVIAGIDFAALKKIHIVFEVSEYYLFVHFNGTSSTHTIGSSYNQSTQQTTSYDSWTYHKDKFEQFSFSNFIPSIRIKYSF